MKKKILFLLLTCVLCTSTTGCVKSGKKEDLSVSAQTDIQKETPVNSENPENPTAEMNSADNSEKDKLQNSQPLLETEYKIEDYYQGCFIVSKSNGYQKKY